MASNIDTNLLILLLLNASALTSASPNFEEIASHLFDKISGCDQQQTVPILKEIGHKFGDGVEIGKAETEKLIEFLNGTNGKKLSDCIFDEAKNLPKSPKSPKSPKKQKLKWPDYFKIACKLIEEYRELCTELTKHLEVNDSEREEILKQCVSLEPVVAFVALFQPIYQQKMHSNGNNANFYQPIMQTFHLSSKHNTRKENKQKSLINLYVDLKNFYATKWNKIKEKMVEIVLAKKRKEIEEAIDTNMIEYSENFWRAGFNEEIEI